MFSSSETRQVAVSWDERLRLRYELQDYPCETDEIGDRMVKIWYGPRKEELGRIFIPGAGTSIDFGRYS